MVRTRDGFGFPYPITGSDQEKARQHSRWLWEGNNWPKAVHYLSWLIRKFAPVPEWEDSETKGLVFYTDNNLGKDISKVVQKQLLKSTHPIVSVSLKPIELGKNIVLEAKRGILTMFKQILIGLEASTADVIFLTEHDVLYHKSHFDFIPPDRTKVYYNTNVFHLRMSDGHALYYTAKRQSQLCAYRDVLLEHYRKRVARVEKDGFSNKMGFEPGSHHRKERIDDLESDVWSSEYPNIDLKHGKNLTPARWKQSEFRDQKNCRDWVEASEIPGWGITKDRVDEFLKEL
jgi:hypothetical protein